MKPTKPKTVWNEKTFQESWAKWELKNKQNYDNIIRKQEQERILKIIDRVGYKCNLIDTDNLKEEILKGKVTK